MMNVGSYLSGRALAWLPVAALLVFYFVSLPEHVSAQDQRDGEITFTGDVAHILQQNCQVCHQPGAIGPMSLLTYQDARRYSRRIKSVVVSRDMPPYPYDGDIGIQDLQHDPRLSDQEIETVVSWVDAGSPLGDPDDMPAPIAWPDPEEWRFHEQFGPPDLVVPAKPFSVPGIGQDLWWEPLVEIPLDEDRYIRAIEVKPSVQGREVVHHANTTLYLPGQDGELEGQGGRFTEYAAGKLGEIVPEGAGRLLPANSFVRWSIHYFPMGEAIENEVTELAFWLHPKGYEPEHTQDLANYRLEGDLAIEPHGTAMVQGFHSFDHPVRIDSYQPHGHLRLRGASVEILDPATGEREIVSMISNLSPWWQHSHMYEEDVAPLIPAGAVIILTHWYDNSDNNPSNPDPEQWVYRGGRTGDEMSHDWIAVTHLDEEGYQRLKAEREAKQRQVAQSSN